MKTVLRAGMLCAAVAGLVGAQAPDTVHSIRISVSSNEADAFRAVLRELPRQNLTIIAEFGHLIVASPVDAPGTVFRFTIVGDSSSASSTILLSATVTEGGSMGFVYQGTGGTGTPATVRAIDRGTNKGKYWARLEELAAALRTVGK